MTNEKNTMVVTLKTWAPIAATIIVLTLTGYILVQQNYRSSANDPQIQIVDDIVEAIEKGTPPDSIVPPSGNTDISKSLAAFVLLYDDNGKQIGSSAKLDGKSPSFPKGVMDNVKKSGNKAMITWQPRDGVRIASVLGRYTLADGKTSGIIIAGRSLREIEIRENQSLIISALGALLALIITFLFSLLSKKMGGAKINAIVMEEVVVENKIN